MTKFTLVSIEDALGLTRLAHSKLVDDLARLLKMQAQTIAYIIAALVVVTAGMPYVRIGTFFVTTFLIPAYMSAQALENEMDYDPDRWFSYWLIYGFWTIFDKAIGRIFKMLPVYWFFRIVILMFLYLSEDYGSTYIFRRFLEPTFQVLQKHAGELITSFEEMTEMQSLIGQKTRK